MNETSNVSNRTAEFLRLFAESSQRIRWYVRAAVPNPDAAEEVFQEASVALWEHFDEFHAGTDFTAWAVRVAHFRILKFRNRQSREAKVFSDSLVDELLLEAGQIVAELDSRRDWLASCFSQLSFPDRDLITRRYTPGANSKQVAEQVGRSQSYVSKALARIHRMLFECISRREVEEGSPT